jgi:hypothetical protein
MAGRCDGSAYKHVLRSGFPQVQTSRRLSSICKCSRRAGSSSAAQSILFVDESNTAFEGVRLHAIRMVVASCHFRARVLVALVGVVLVEDGGRGL